MQTYRRVGECMHDKLFSTFKEILKDTICKLHKHTSFNNIIPALKRSLILFVITASGDVPCGGPERSPHTSSIVHIIYSFCSYNRVTDKGLSTESVV